MQPLSQQFGLKTIQVPFLSDLRRSLVFLANCIQGLLISNMQLITYKAHRFSFEYQKGTAKHFRRNAHNLCTTRSHAAPSRAGSATSEISTWNRGPDWDCLRGKGTNASSFSPATWNLINSHTFSHSCWKKNLNLLRHY